MRCWHQPLCSGFFSLQWRHRITMATRKHASPRRRNSSFRLRSKCMTFPRRKEDLIKWFFTSWNFCVDMLKRKTQLTANGFTVKAAMKNSVVSVRLILKCFNEQMRFFFFVFFFRVTLKRAPYAAYAADMSKTLFFCSNVSAAEWTCLFLRTCCLSTNYRRTPPCKSAVRTNSKAICLIYVRYTAEHAMFGGLVV